MSCPAPPATLVLAALVLAGCQVGARHGVFEPTPAPLPPTFEGFPTSPAPPAAPAEGQSPSQAPAQPPVQ